MVGIPVPKKVDVEQYSVKCLAEPKILENGLIKVDGMATGFLRLSKKALKHLWDNSEPYVENGIEKRMVFNVAIVNGELYSEDIMCCESLRSLGVYLDPRFTCAHVGTKVYGGKFNDWLQRLQAARKEQHAR